MRERIRSGMRCRWPSPLGDEAERLRRDEPQRVVAEVTIARSGQRGVLYDALGLQEFDLALLEVIARRRRLKGRGGNVVAWRGPLLRALSRRATAALESAPLKTTQRHTSIRYGERFVLKLFRRLHWGINPELELGRFLTERDFPHAPPLAGALEYHRADGERLGLAAVHGWLAQGGERLGIHVARPGPVLRAGALAGDGGQEDSCRRASR